MNTNMKVDWEPMSDDVLRDQRTAYDDMRERCPVAYSEFMHWSLFRHDDIVRVLHDHETFSNAVSKHISVPHGIDPPEHSAYRRIIDPYFSAERMNAFEPACREIVAEVVQDALVRGEVEAMTDIALPFAVRVQCAFLGWPATLHESLVLWTKKNQEATLSQNRQALADVAREFDDVIDAQLEARRYAGTRPEDDVTASLMHEQIQGRALSREEIASILRNWTAGEVGTISAAVGILAHYLAAHDGEQAQLRTQPALLPAAIDEILRIHGPLVANRRITTCPVEIGGRKINAGEHISMIWISGNRDGGVFVDPDVFRLDRDVSKNLLYGAGIHVCPGAPLARLELRLFVEELLRRTTRIDLVPGREPVNATYPASGFAALPLVIQSAG